MCQPAFYGCENNFSRLVWPSNRKQFSYKEVQFKQFYMSVKTYYPSAENVNENVGMPNTLTGNKHASS